MVRVGDEAPDFELPVHIGGTFRLSEHRGRSTVVLYFYPADFTLGCTQEACSFQNQFAYLQQLNTVVVGISPDDLDTHRRFAERHGLEFLLASDPRKKVIGQYGALWLGGLLVKRITFVIDTSGVVRGMIHHEFRWKRHSEEVRALLQTLS
jgi:peroxiredoxin Q/BCP